jgi:2-polyprenyl-6-hydroxyphenyl methylase/3-demethylubiquinone-9 3-methyltransferase
LHALAAIRMGAARVVGVDIDADSVAASRGTLARFAPEANARFDVVSVFDMTPETHGGFDVVYSWGVLHHTGDMYGALTVAAGLVQPGGKFLVALYRHTPFCSMWRSIKRWYSRATPRNQAYARSTYIRLHRILLALRGRSLDDLIRDYGKRRGMDYYNDVHDWMGGYPYESISPKACRAFFASLGFGLERDFVRAPGRFLPGLMGSGCDEYVFGRI